MHTTANFTTIILFCLPCSKSIPIHYVGTGFLMCLSRKCFSSRGHQSRPPPIPWETTPSSPPSLLPPRPGQERGGRSSEGSLSLPPRHIRRYPTSSSGSSCSTPGPGTGSLDEGGEEEVFLQYNQSYHTFSKHFHTDRLRTQ